MRRCARTSFVVFAGLIMSAVPAVGQTFTPVVGWDHQLFPAYIISTATVKTTAEDEANRLPEQLGDLKSVVGIAITAPADDTAIRLTVSCGEIMEPSTFTGVLPTEGVAYTVSPTVRYKFSELARISQITPVTMTFQVTVGDADPVEQTDTVTVRPVNDCPLSYQVGDQSRNVMFTLAAYVNEQHPYIDKLLREALDVGIVDSFDDHQSGEARVLQQVYAIWDVLVARDMRYSNITTTGGDASSVSSQHVRMIDQSLNNSQANCVDGSVLLASLLRKVGIEPFLVIVPGHCYVGFYLDPEQQKPVALETTLMGARITDAVPSVPFLDEAIAEDLRVEASWASFVSATNAGTQSFLQNTEKFAAPDEVLYRVIPIGVARKAGILPLAFTGTEQFRSNDALFVTTNDEFTGVALEADDEPDADDTEGEFAECEDAECEDAECEDAECEDGECEDAECEDGECEDAE